MPRTPSPTKRRRREGTEDDNNNDEARNDATPRPTLLPTRHSSSSRDNTSSDANNQPFSAQEHVSVSRTSSQSMRSSRSSQSSRSQLSPIKRDLAMRFARDLPIQYRSISNAPDHIQPLVEQVVDLESKQGILPGCLRTTLQAYRSPSEPIRDYMFDDLQGDQGPEVDMRTLDRELERLLEIRDNTQECNSRARVFHEVEWNETVHSPMLRLVTKRITTLACRNLTQTSVSSRWANPEFQDSRINYGIFIAPDSHSDLYRSMVTYIQERRDATGAELGQINPLVDIDIDRPLAIAVETKRLATGVEKANTQLASFGRCILRFQHDITAFRADTPSASSTSKSNNSSHAFVLPLLTVIGSAWEVDFMVHEKNLAVIYGPISLGSTQTLTNCYRLYRSLGVLFQWAHQHCVEWWTAILQST
ncbi:putative L-aminoadipate-semialdehyde dehydrogenase [Rosellinia necatrix]|uniref:Putative L-aminoadipate-semialdehyde dehydrogenase n=1 Tax=Rosellinia necatrix TaxID=77044 RepID=A0A1W2TTY4_ROSNE|nr:putative L-aminoadipate-semialdehyde dehydrogenase [Rosellinia necatrix]